MATPPDPYGTNEWHRPRDGGVPSPDPYAEQNHFDPYRSAQPSWGQPESSLVVTPSTSLSQPGSLAGPASPRPAHPGSALEPAPGAIPLPPSAGPMGATLPTNQLAIVAIVLAGVGFTTFVTWIGGIVCGHIALSQIRNGGGREQGRGLAVAALWMSYGGIALSVIGVLAYFIWLFWIFASISQF